MVAAVNAKLGVEVDGDGAALPGSAQKQRDSLFRLFENAPGFVAILEGPEHRFVFTNAAYLKLVHRESVVGKTLREALPEVVSQGFVDLLDEIYISGRRITLTSVPVELQSDESAEEHLHYVNLVYEPMTDEDGEVTGIFVSGHDVTEEVVAQQNLNALRAEVLHLSRLSAMGTMASTLAHELNQPLTAIRNYARGLQNFVVQGSALQDLEIAVAEIVNNTSRVAEIIRSARDMLKKGESNKEPFLLQGIAREAGALLKLAAPGSPRVDFRLQDGVLILGDPVQIQQVLINLIRNACEAAQEVESPRVTVRSCVSDGSAMIAVEDNGTGIKPGQAEKVFEAFSSTKPNGLGIGLSICRTIVEAHSGKIWVESRPDGGSKFCFSLPLAGEPDMPQMAAHYD